MTLSRRPADGLDDDDACYLLDNFFMANPGHDDPAASALSRAVPACGRRGTARPSRRCAGSAPRDLRDLQVWSNLAWIHPLLFEKDPELAEFKAKGRHYTEDEKQWFLDKQRELLARVIPLHRKLAERGQIELTTTPYYHPILPLLLDKTLAREAMPDVALPGLSRRLSRGRRGARPPRRREPRPALRRAAARACGRARARSARR